MDIRITLPEFYAQYTNSTPHIMWLLGAGCSIPAGIPSADELTWEFKKLLYTFHTNSDRGHTSEQDFRAIVQQWCNGQRGWPERGSDIEYAFYFEKYLKEPRVRSQYIERQVEDAKPSPGHFALCELIRRKHVELLWTTNFDRLIERAALGTLIDKFPDGIAWAGLDPPERAWELIRKRNGPILIKLHGDFRDGLLRNTDFELKQPNRPLEALKQQCEQRGLAVVGYSGRDPSVVPALKEVLDAEHSFPDGLYWFTHSGEQPNASVLDLLEKAKRKGCEAGYVEIDGFDELFRKLCSLNYPAEQAAKNTVVDDVRQSRPVIDIPPKAPMSLAGNSRMRRKARIDICGIAELKEFWILAEERAYLQEARERLEAVPENERVAGSGRKLQHNLLAIEGRLTTFIQNQRDGWIWKLLTLEPPLPLSCRCALLWCLSGAPQLADIKYLLSECLAHPAAQVRLETATLLGQSSSKVRRAASRTAVIETLRSRMSSDPSVAVQVACMKALESYAAPTDLPFLIELWREAESREMLDTAERCFSRIAKTPEGILALLGRVCDMKLKVKYKALERLKQDAVEIHSTIPLNERRLLFEGLWKAIEGGRLIAKSELTDKGLPSYPYGSGAVEYAVHLLFLWRRDMALMLKEEDLPAYAQRTFCDRRDQFLQLEGTAEAPHAAVAG